MENDDFKLSWFGFILFFLLFFVIFDSEDWDKGFRFRPFNNLFWRITLSFLSFKQQVGFVSIHVPRIELELSSNDWVFSNDSCHLDYFAFLCDKELSWIPNIDLILPFFNTFFDWQLQTILEWCNWRYKLVDFAKQILLRLIDNFLNFFTTNVLFYLVIGIL